jgi:hypothetical protein
MNELLQTLFIAGGGLGCLVSAPIAAYGWLMHRGFGGDLTSEERTIRHTPLFCLVLIAAGLVWRKFEKKKQGPFKLSEDGGAFTVKK